LRRFGRRRLAGQALGCADTNHATSWIRPDSFSPDGAQSRPELRTSPKQKRQIPGSRVRCGPE
jgi:hypothetical protein